MEYMATLCPFFFWEMNLFQLRDEHPIHGLIEHVKITNPQTWIWWLYTQHDHFYGSIGILILTHIQILND